MPADGVPLLPLSCVMSQDDDANGEPHSAASSITFQLGAASAGIVRDDVNDRGRKRHRSDIWEHFGETADEVGDRVVSCKHCSVSYKNPQGTSTMRRHYKTVHATGSASQTTLTPTGKVAELQPLVGDAA